MWWGRAMLMARGFSASWRFRDRTGFSSASCGSAAPPPVPVVEVEEWLFRGSLDGVFPISCYDNKGEGGLVSERGKGVDEFFCR